LVGRLDCSAGLDSEVYATARGPVPRLSRDEEKRRSVTNSHIYTSCLSWQGSTGVGYDAYNRTHRVLTPPADG
jgi:hypothetical protein